jgi:hypothetical protein
VDSERYLGRSGRSGTKETDTFRGGKEGDGPGGTSRGRRKLDKDLLPKETGKEILRGR